MKCEMFENHLDGYFDGSLSELERQSMEEHMQACPECRREYEAQKLLLEELRHLDDGVTAPPDLVSGAMERIRRERQPRKRRAAYWLGGAAAAALCLTLALGTLLGALSGSLLPARLLSALNVALYGMFLAVVIPPSRGNAVLAGVVLISMALSALFAWLPVLNELSSGFTIILLTILIAGGAAWLFPVKEDAPPS